MRIVIVAYNPVTSRSFKLLFSPDWLTTAAKQNAIGQPATWGRGHIRESDIILEQHCARMD